MEIIENILVRSYTVNLSAEEAQAVTHFRCLDAGTCVLVGGIDRVREIFLNLAEQVRAAGAVV